MPKCKICSKPVASDAAYHVINVSANINDPSPTFIYVHDACADGQSTMILRERFIEKSPT